MRFPADRMQLRRLGDKLDRADDVNAPCGSDFWLSHFLWPVALGVAGLLALLVLIDLGFQHYRQAGALFLGMLFWLAIGLFWRHRRRWEKARDARRREMLG